MTTLNDIDIIDEMRSGKLVTDGDENQVAGACYELRQGNIYYDLTESDHLIQAASNQDILIKPGHRVVLITQEKLALPDNVLSRIVSKGSLFSIGLSPVATYADPGFSGNIGIVTQNLSDKYILLPQGEPIAKADFTRLTGNASRPYRGQHGFSSQIWPIKHHLQKSYAEVADDRRVKFEKEESYRLLPQETASALQKLERGRLLTDMAILSVVVLNAISVFMVGNKLLDNVQGLIGNLLSTAIVGFVTIYIKRRR